MQLSFVISTSWLLTAIDFVYQLPQFTQRRRVHRSTFICIDFFKTYFMAHCCRLAVVFWVPLLKPKRESLFGGLITKVERQVQCLLNAFSHRSFPIFALPMIYMLHAYLGRSVESK